MARVAPDADEVRARTQERMNQDAQAAPAPSPASDVEKPKYSLDADEVRERTAEQMKEERAEKLGDQSSWIDEMRQNLVGSA